MSVATGLRTFERVVGVGGCGCRNDKVTCKVSAPGVSNDGR